MVVWIARPFGGSSLGVDDRSSPMLMAFEWNGIWVYLSWLIITERLVNGRFGGYLEMFI